MQVLAPLFRTAIGFDRLTNSLLDAAQDVASPSYPPYNIEVTGDDTYRVTMAVAGFTQDQIEITAQDGKLLVVGKASKPSESRKVLYQGIAGRSFERRFTLADHMIVDKAELELGLLHIDLSRVVPEALKPRKIEINKNAAAAHPEADAPAS